MRWLLVATLNIVEAPSERGADVEADPIRPWSGFAGPCDLCIDQTGALFNGFLRRDIESLPPSLTPIRDEYVGLGKELTKLRLAFLVAQLKQGGPHSDMRGVVPERVLDIGWPPHVERVGAMQRHCATDRWAGNDVSCSELTDTLERRLRIRGKWNGIAFAYFLHADEGHQPHGLGESIHLQHVFDVAGERHGDARFLTGFFKFFTVPLFHRVAYLFIVATLGLKEIECSLA